jgi:hypothetical protein
MEMAVMEMVVMEVTDLDMVTDVDTVALHLDPMGIFSL